MVSKLYIQIYLKSMASYTRIDIYLAWEAYMIAEHMTLLLINSQSQVSVDLIRSSSKKGYVRSEAATQWQACWQANLVTWQGVRYQTNIKAKCQSPMRANAAKSPQLVLAPLSSVNRWNCNCFYSCFVQSMELFWSYFPAHILRHVEDVSVGIASRYGLDGPGIESRWGRDFPLPTRPALGPTQPPIQWVPGSLSRG